MNYGKIFIGIRNENNQTQGELAESLGITQTYLSLLENNLKKPSLVLLERVSDLKGVSLPLLLVTNISREDVSEEKLGAYDALIGPLTELAESV